MTASRLGVALPAMAILAQVAVANFGVASCFGSIPGRAETPYLLTLLGLLVAGTALSLRSLRCSRLGSVGLFLCGMALPVTLVPSHAVRYAPLEALWP